MENYALFDGNKSNFRTGLPTHCLQKENQQQQRDNFQQNTAVSWAATIQKKILLKYYAEEGITIF